MLAVGTWQADHVNSPGGAYIHDKHLTYSNTLSTHNVCMHNMLANRFHLCSSAGSSTAHEEIPGDDQHGSSLQH